MRVSEYHYVVVSACSKRFSDIVFVYHHELLPLEFKSIGLPEDPFSRELLQKDLLSVIVAVDSGKGAAKVAEDAECKWRAEVSCMKDMCDSAAIEKINSLPDCGHVVVSVGDDSDEKGLASTDCRCR